MLKLSAGFVILFITLALQALLASAGVYANLTFAALISFAFIFGFWELAALVLLAVFVMNWQPAASVEILIFALYPLAVHFSRGILRWQPWIEPPIAIVVGFFVFYLILSPEGFAWRWFFFDAAAGLAFGAMVFFPLYRWRGS